MFLPVFEAGPQSQTSRCRPNISVKLSRPLPGSRVGCGRTRASVFRVLGSEVRFGSRLTVNRTGTDWPAEKSGFG